jgi:hypothetical protein
MNNIKTFRTSKKRFTYIFYANIFYLLFFLASCTTEKEKKTLPDANVYTLIFMDKTQSVNVNKVFVAQKYQQILTDLVQQNIQKKGDKLEVYFIHENTQKAKALSLTSRTEMGDTEAMNVTDKEAAQTTYSLMIERERMVFLKQLLSKLNLQNTDASQQQTDIWASLPVVGKAAETGAEVRVYYLSDMIESMKGTGRRDFHTNAPQNNAEAETWAKADAKNLKYTLGACTIKMALPFEPTSSTAANNPTITTYWAALLQELGAMSVEEI